MRASPAGLPSLMVLVVAAGVLLLAAAPAPGPGADVRGTYRLTGQATVDARPFPARQDEVRADAILSPGLRAGEVRIHLAGQGVVCELSASLDAAGGLALAPGQRCVADLRTDETEGRVEARLVSGVGRLRDEALELELAFALSGSVRLRAGGTLDALGKALSLPGAGGDPIPVQGEARGRAQGQRDRSRAGQ